MADKSLITVTDGEANVKLHHQKDTFWCYAAALSVVTALLNPGAGWAPCQIVSRLVWKKHLEEVDDEYVKVTCNCCLAESKRSQICKGANAAGNMTNAFNYINLAAARASGVPGFGAVRTDIDADRPIIVTLGAPSAPAGHVILVVGYDYNSGSADDATTQMLRIYDPSSQATKYANLVDRTGTFLLSMADLSQGYHKTTITVQSNYTGVRFAGGGMTAPPDWAKWI